MTFSLSTNWLNSSIESGEEIAAKAKALGFGELELGFRTTDLQAVEIVKCGVLPVGSVHAFCPVPISAPEGHPELYQLASFDEEVRAMARFQILKNVRFAAEVGATALVLHAGKIKRGGWFAKRRSRRMVEIFKFELEKLVGELEKHKVKLGLENMPYKEGFPNGDEVTQVTGDWVRPWLDTGHKFALDGATEKLSDEATPLGFHLNDSVGGDDHLAPGNGKIDFSVYREAMKKTEHLVFEPNCGVDESSIIKGLDMIRKIIGCVVMSAAMTFAAVYSNAGTLEKVDPMIGTEGTGSEYGGMMPMTGVPFGSFHLVPMTRTNAVGRTSFNALDRELLGFTLTRQPAIWMGEFGKVTIQLAKPAIIESIDAKPYLTVVKAGGKTYRLAANANAAVIESDDESFAAEFSTRGVTSERTVRVSTNPIKNFACRWEIRKVNCRVAVGVSLISAEKAEKFALAAEKKGVAGIAAEAKAKWETFFDRVEIEADERVKTIFFTGLYHALLYPREFTEEGEYYSAMDDRVHKGRGFSCFSLWDTYRSEHPLLTLLAPDYAGAMMNSLVKMYEEGGWLPIWPNPGYTGVMIGDPAAVVLSEAYVKGIKGFDAEKAFEAVLHNAECPQPDDTMRTWQDTGGDSPGCPETRGGLTWYLKNGYVAHDKTSEAVSRTLDYSLADASIAKFARALGKIDVAEKYERRAKNYTNLWNAAKACFLPRTSEGEWCAPLRHDWGTYGYTETNEKSARWCVPHDVEGLVALMGGKEKFEEELDKFFEEDFWKTDTVGNKSVHGNETCHHVAYLYNRIGKYAKTCRRVREILERAYSTDRKGFDGNEDCGAMSAWYILSSLGMYPIDPASGEYELGSPIVRHARLVLAEGTLEIEAKGEGAIVRRVVFNGKELKSRRINHNDLVKGGKLIFEKGDEDVSEVE